MKKTKLILPLIFFICGVAANAQSVTIDPKGNLTPILEIKSTTEESEQFVDFKIEFNSKNIIVAT
jgi:hypothetical protein